MNNKKKLLFVVVVVAIVTFNLFLNDLYIYIYFKFICSLESRVKMIIAINKFNFLFFLLWWYFFVLFSNIYWYIITLTSIRELSLGNLNSTIEEIIKICLYCVFLKFIVKKYNSQKTDIYTFKKMYNVKSNIKNDFIFEF